MESVLVRIIFSGLIAFVPEGDSRQMEITALLADARTPPRASDGCPIHPHSPFLFFKNRGTSGGCGVCTPKGDLCVCALDRTGIVLKDSLYQRGCGPKGGRRCDVKGFDLIAKMSRIRMTAATVNKKCMQGYASPSTSEVPDFMVAGMYEIPVNGKIIAIKKVGEQLVRDPSEAASSGIDHFEFTSLSSRTWFAHRPSELAEVLLVPTLVGYEEVTSLNLDCEVGDYQKPETSAGISRTGCRGQANCKEVNNQKVASTDQKVVKLCLSSFDPRGSSLPIFVPVEECARPDGGKLCADIYVNNEMSIDSAQMTHGFCHDLDIGRHFEMFYEMAENEIWPDEKPVPHLKRKESPAQADVSKKIPANQNGPKLDFDFDFVANVRKVLRAGEQRPICPPVTLTP